MLYCYEANTANLSSQNYGFEASTDFTRIFTRQVHGEAKQDKQDLLEMAGTLSQGQIYD
jgi:hypothetical protein